jgi:hypothetical protein
MPTLGVVLNLLYKLQSGTNYLIAGQYTAGSIDAIIDDLTPGEYYTIAVQAFSAFGIGSTVRVVTGTNALAPINATPPAAPTAVTYIAGNSSSFERPAEIISQTVAYSVRVNWTPPATKSVLSYESVKTVDDTDAAADYNYSLGNFFRSSIPEEIFSDLNVLVAYIRVRSVDRSGQKSAWAGGGVNLASPTNYWGIPGPTLMRQNASAVSITGGTASLASVTASTARAASLVVAPAAATNPRAQVAIYAGSDVNTFPGGAATYDLDVDITNRGFTAKPDWGLIQVYDTNFLGVYDFDNGSTITVARFVIFSKDNGNLASGDRRYHFILGKY